MAGLSLKALDLIIIHNFKIKRKSYITSHSVLIYQ